MTRLALLLPALALPLLGFASSAKDEVRVSHSGEASPEDVRKLLELLGARANSFTFRTDSGAYRLSVVMSEYRDGELVQEGELWGDDLPDPILAEQTVSASHPVELELYSLETRGAGTRLQASTGILSSVRTLETDEGGSYRWNAAWWLAEEGVEIVPGERIPIIAFTQPYWDESMESYRYCFFDTDMSGWSARYAIPHLFLFSAELSEL